MAETTDAAAERPDGRSTQTVADRSDEATVRDRVWDATLSYLSDRPIPFKAWRIRRLAGLDPAQDRTIRRTLTVMAEIGWLDHEENSKWWYPGEKAKARFEIEYPV